MTSVQRNALIQGIALGLVFVFAVISLLVLAGIAGSYFDTFHITHSHRESLFDATALIIFPLIMVVLAMVKGWRS